MNYGRIVKLSGGNYYVFCDGQTYKCRARGKFRFEDTSPLVGDVVEFKITENLEGYLLRVLERKNVLKRPSVANVDCGIIVNSIVEPFYSTYLVDKMIVAVKMTGIEPIILFTKSDLVSDNHEIYALADYYNSINIQTLVVNNLRDNSELKKIFINKVGILIGQSGSGKSSFINSLSQEFQIDVQPISKALGRGKHTTRHTELYQISEDFFLVDAPGFSAFEFEDLSSEEVKDYFDDFQELSTKCKFRSCTHLHEPNCAVRAHAQEDKLFLGRYQNYVKYIEEINSQKRKW